ncbi:transporter substrate-binding domain-containing protein [Ancylobacter oerskovii]|uniref:Transporter substrate-binding domain-containing protein n=1 Tax=Ancylobacter oerskovii TaxID=459519 RepID=A0ABW4YSD9_9HYPH|nr:transporter substrate-binding domain-containing protein [Ancylobacter oerskovii]MBS7545149.1 amino acid ABC transporter substrate-binding protein [Ancylobacter oerskovii]
MTRTASRRLALAALGLVAALFSAPAPAAAQLTVGVHHDNRPWEFRDASGNFVGFDIDMMEALGERLGVAVELRPLGFGQLFEELEAGRLDAVASSITATPERRLRFDFTQPYYRTSQAVVVLKSAGIKDLAGLSGKIVATTPNSTNARWLEANKGHQAIRAIRYVDGLDEALALLRGGEVAAYFGDEPALLYALLGSRDLAVVARLPTQEAYAIMLGKGSRWKARLDDALAALKANGQMVTIHRKWFGNRPSVDSPIYRILPRD